MSTQQYQRHIMALQKILSFKKELKRNFGNKNKMIVQAFAIMKCHMDRSLRKETVKPNEDEVKCVTATLNLLIDVVISKPINNYLRDMSFGMSKLFYNWNNSVNNSEDITRKAQLLERTVTAQNTLNETILVAQMVLRKLRAEMSRTPVAYELSRHYLNSLLMESKE